MFDPVDPKQRLPELEEGILQYWKEEGTFKRSIHQRMHTLGKAWEADTASESSETFSFYDGPPFATGLPHYGHLLAGTIKDVIPRYQTMRGKAVERRFGWDCHGLPIENLIEKEHNISSKQEIEEMGVKNFNNLCRSSVSRYTDEWRTVVERMGRWVDMDWDYKTMDPDFMESIWWVFEKLYEKGLIYEGYKSMHICPRCVTPLSNFEVSLGYKDISDWTSITEFPLQDDPQTILLAWTTTSWTLPGNLFLALGKDITYVSVQQEGDQKRYIVAENLVDNVFHDRSYTITGTVQAEDLEGKHYIPLFSYFVEKYADQGAFRIVFGDFVTTENGTGIVHIAPGFGTDDYEIGKREGVDILSHVTMEGTMIHDVTDFAGMSVKPTDDPTKTDKKITHHLQEAGRLFDAYSYKHSYPHCWRCDSPLINYSMASWFVAVEQVKEKMLNANAKTTWVPAHIRDGRFGKWLENARDWCISRNRYWGTPLPIWRSEDGEEVAVLGSRDDLFEHCTERFTKVTAIRHAESEGNLVPIYQGKVPGTDLTERGIKQATEAGEWLRSGRRLDVIYTSPLARTQQTAEILAQKTGATVLIDDRLTEVDFGKWEKTTVDFSDLAFVKERRMHKLHNGKPESIYHLDGMESWKSVYGRISAFMEEILPKHPGEHIAIVTHADLMVNIEHFFTKEDPIKLSHRPYPQKAVPKTYFYDHETGLQMDLHKDTVDDMTWKNRNGVLMRRIPDVLDCWFESGSMPYAQEHYPFEMRHHHAKAPLNFPANFIAENLDQTRGWFYTLIVLSSALFDEPAFENCICGGMILAEDGKKMSKRLKNYPDPTEVMNKHGADALRFTLMSSPVVRAQEIRFSEKPVEETVKNVLLPFWNTYSFFVTYANAAGFEPTGSRKHSTHPLDIWIRAEVQDLANRMTTELDNYDLSATCQQIHETIDALTNWYVRLSRRRFAGKGALDSDNTRTQSAQDTQDQLDALHTLYDVLLTISQLLAPFCPYITEAVYLNLVAEEHGSIHLTDWPETRELSAAKQALLENTRIMRLIVSLGNSIRGEAKVKIRQPLQNAIIALPPHMQDTITWLNDDTELLRQELNVKTLQFADNPESLAEQYLFVDARKIGPQFGKETQQIIVDGKAGNFTILEDGRYMVGEYLLGPDDAHIAYRGKEGQNVAADKGVVVSLETEITEALQLEGEARDLIRAVQRLRKEAGLAFTDHITLSLEGADDILTAHADLILQETRSTLGETPASKVSVSLEHRSVSIGFEQQV